MPKIVTLGLPCNVEVNAISVHSNHPSGPNKLAALERWPDYIVVIPQDQIAMHIIKVTGYSLLINYS